MVADTTTLVSLTRSECLRLLRRHPVHVARIGVVDVDGQPVVLPVNYRMDGDAVVIRTDPASLLAEQAGGRPVAVEVDDVDPAWREGWSVLVQGTAEVVTDEAELARLRRLPLHPWAPGDRSRYLRIEPAALTGRRIV